MGHDGARPEQRNQLHEFVEAAAGDGADGRIGAAGGEIHERGVQGDGEALPVQPVRHIFEIARRITLDGLGVDSDFGIESMADKMIEKALTEHGEGHAHLDEAPQVAHGSLPLIVVIITPSIKQV